MDPAEVTHLAGLDYPDAVTVAPDVDVLVIREGHTIRLINRTADRFVSPQVWVNQQYVREIDALGPGEERRMSLGRFVNVHEETFPLGLWWRPEATDPLVSCELFDAASAMKYRAVVQREGSGLELGM